jgi:kynureninase
MYCRRKFYEASLETTRMVQEASSAPTTIPPQRHLFDIPAEVTYLNCANMAPQLRGVGAAGIAAVQARNAPWELSPEGWFSAAERLRGLFARIVNADAEGIALVPSVSYGMAIAAANVPVRRGRQLLITHVGPTLTPTVATRRAADVFGGPTHTAREGLTLT